MPERGSQPRAVAVPPGRGLLFTAGIIARNSEGVILAPRDTEGQIRIILEDIRTILAEAAGCTLDDVIKVTFYLRDIEQDLSVIRRIRSEYWPTNPPVSTGVEVSRLMTDAVRVEIEVVALLPEATGL